MISGFITVSPINPQTTEGMAASNSTTILRISRILVGQNSEMKIAVPIPNGTAINIARQVTLPVPTIRASTP